MTGSIPITNVCLFWPIREPYNYTGPTRPHSLKSCSERITGVVPGAMECSTTTITTAAPTRCWELYGGTAQVQLGGEQGLVLSIQAGDVLIIPAGVAHKNLGGSRDFHVVGAYPDGQRPDICYGRDGERPQADRNIARLARPQEDPLYGADGPLFEHWLQTLSA